MFGAGFHLTNKLQRAQSDASHGRSISNNKLHASSSSNVERFLESVTPSVPAHYLPQTMVKERRGSDGIELQSPPYFVLGDVWESFAEWSAYGTGVPLSLNNNNNNSYKDRVFQYYVPSLSAIQIYADYSHPLTSTRRQGEESDSDFKDSSSEGSSSESERGLSLRKEHLEDSSSDDGEALISQGRLIFEYLERDLPYIREPFADKMSDLASSFPELKTLRSCDLLPSSWFAVAWYPIYKIPTGPTLKDLDACFLTYHSLHTPFQGAGVTTQSMCELQPKENVEKTILPVFGLASYKLRGSVWTSIKTTQSMCELQPKENVEKTILPVFGLASYKLRGSVWTSIKGSNHQLVNSLFKAADNWLRLRQVNHPDFIFFCR